MKKPLFEYLLEKQEQKTITETEKKVMEFYLQVYLLPKYFNIAVQYLKGDKVQAEVQEMFSGWTGFENYEWFIYHYESVGNALYAYTKACESILNYLNRKIANFPSHGKTLLRDFISDVAIQKVLSDRHDATHQYGKWRSEISSHLVVQDWKSVELQLVPTIINVRDKAEIFSFKFIEFINEQIQP